MGDLPVIEATGKSPEQWFALLDEQSAEKWTHTQIADWLSHEHAVPAWWRQNVAVRYEQARGMRLPGQRADGTFELSKSRTVALDQHAALDSAIAVISAELGPPTSEGRTATYLRARWKLAGKESVLVSADPPKTGKTPLVLTYAGLASSEELDAARDRLATWLAAVD